MNKNKKIMIYSIIFGLLELGQIFVTFLIINKIFFLSIGLTILFLMECAQIFFGTLGAISLSKKIFELFKILYIKIRIKNKEQRKIFIEKYI